MKEKFLIILILIAKNCASQYQSLLLAESSSIAINQCTLGSKDGKRCTLFNVLSKGNPENSGLDGASILVTIKVFYDSLDSKRVFQIVSYDSIKRLEMLRTEQLVNRLSKSLKESCSRMLEDTISGNKNQYPWVYTFDVEQLFFKLDTNYYKVSKAIIYVQAHLLYNFMQSNKFQSTMNLINTESVLVKLPGYNSGSIPSDVWNLGRTFKTATNNDGSVHLVRIPPVVDDDDVNGRRDEFTFLPGFGVVSFHSYVYRNSAHKRIEYTPERILEIQEEQSKVPWKYEEYYYFQPVKNCANLEMFMR